MKNLLYIILSVIFLISCDKDGYWQDYYTVEVWFGEMNPEGPDHLIDAHQGFRADMGELLTFEAKDGPGYRFLGWRKLPNSYCSYTPIVDEDNPNICYVYMDMDYMGNCNVVLENVRIMAQYIKILN